MKKLSNITNKKFFLCKIYTEEANERINNKEKVQNNTKPIEKQFFNKIIIVKLSKI